MRQQVDSTHAHSTKCCTCRIWAMVALFCVCALTYNASQSRGLQPSTWFRNSGCECTRLSFGQLPTASEATLNNSKPQTSLGAPEHYSDQPIRVPAAQQTGQASVEPLMAPSPPSNDEGDAGNRELSAERDRLTSALAAEKETTRKNWRHTKLLASQLSECKAELSECTAVSGNKLTTLEPTAVLIDEQGVSCPYAVGSSTPNATQLGDLTSSRVFLVGDSIMGQLGLLGKPGLCCNSRVLCDDDVQPFGDRHVLDSYRRNINTTEYGVNTSAWQHAWEMIGRGPPGRHPQVIYLAPLKSNQPSKPIATIMEHPDMTPGKDDILIMGLLGNHFGSKDIADLESFTKDLIVNVVNKFPGRVAILGASPQHFKGDGSYRAAKEKKCGPVNFNVTRGPNLVELRNVLWSYTLRKHLAHDRTTEVDVYRLLYPLWMCHRAPTDCTHWNDGVYNLLTTTVLKALASLTGKDVPSSVDTAPLGQHHLKSATGAPPASHGDPQHQHRQNADLRLALDLA